MRLLAAAAIVLLLAGCTTRIPMPKGPDLESGELTQKMFDATWDATELPDSAARPTISESQPTDDWYSSIAACLARDDITIRGVNSEDSAFTTDLQGDLGDNELKLAWYVCFIRTPPDLTTMMGQRAMSADELEYLWDYYARWVTPCLAAQGHPVVSPPAHDQFVASGTYNWNPYWSVPSVETEAEYTRVLALCGDPLGMLADR